MKKIVKKILLIWICLFCIICQLLSCNVYAYNIEEVKELSDFKTVEADGVPDSYDVFIDAKNLISNERLPSGIRTSIEDVLYNDSGLLSIDFFGNEKDQPDNISEKEKNNAKQIRSFVRNVYRVLLYIGLASMLVVLIYMAVVIVVSGISPTMNILPFSNLIKGKKGETPKENKKAKEFVEQWFKAVISLALTVVVMNLVVAFSNNIVDDVKGRGDDNKLITVYVKNSKYSVDAPILGLSGSSSSSSTTSSTTASTSGNAAELRKKVVEQAKSLENLGASGGQCEKWVELVYRTALNRADIPYQCCAHKAGQNAIYASSTQDNIVPGAAVFSYKSSSGTTDSACGQDAGHVGIYIGDGKIASCTGRGDTGIVICTIDEWKASWEFSCWGWLPGTEDLSNGATGDNLSDSSSGDTQTRIVDYYFKTNLQGLLMFQSQFAEQDYILKGTLSLVSGMILTVFKMIAYCTLVARMMLVAFISVIAPVLILVNSFIKISGGKGILRKWIILYLYLVLLQPVVALIYYMMIQSNVYLVSKFPFYAVLVCIGIGIIFAWSLRRLIRCIRAK